MNATGTQEKKQESDLLPNSSQLLDLSLFEIAYGKQIRYLAEGSKLNSFVSNQEIQKDDLPISSRLKSKMTKPRQKLNASLESGCWMYKVQQASMSKSKVFTRLTLSF